MHETSPGHFKASFENMTDEELDRFIESGGGQG
jgi:hypothetical protein